MPQVLYHSLTKINEVKANNLQSLSMTVIRVVLVDWFIFRHVWSASFTLNVRVYVSLFSRIESSKIWTTKHSIISGVIVIVETERLRSVTEGKKFLSCMIF